MKGIGIFQGSWRSCRRLSEPLILDSLDILNLTLMMITLQNHVIDIVKTFRVHYISAHNNETLFDIVSLKGISFFHPGDEMLHSKLLDCDSYNSGDWINGIQPGLADQLFKPQKNHILAAVNNFSNLLQTKGTHNTGSSLVPRVIVMSIDNGHEGVPGYSYIVVIINSCPCEISFFSPALRARTLQLHPIQLILTDHVAKSSTFETSTGCFSVPAMITFVFVEPWRI
ncbi:hypothetical protein FEM48_Zijuj03G0057800 [Ziziphus jujuba var. spinosa]|uniref:Alpha-1,6-glucosidases pullulanase-type C-terminal domain-containing protein n=1 Tax=Ziziphus jujuba var. spinosa TaxID=714518 RepID=A0A978VNJ2_ZIZJJ|nr:hypothetical protein FEM48_Zijuj03G0057800 [Ziziphus jujuba var. spinosa]